METTATKAVKKCSRTRHTNLSPTQARVPELNKLAWWADRLGTSIDSLRGEIHANRLKAYRLRPGCNAPLMLAERDVAEWLEGHASKRTRVLSPSAVAQTRRECEAVELAEEREASLS